MRSIGIILLFPLIVAALHFISQQRDAGYQRAASQDRLKLIEARARNYSLRQQKANRARLPHQRLATAQEAAPNPTQLAGLVGVLRGLNKHTPVLVPTTSNPADATIVQLLEIPRADALVMERTIELATNELLKLVVAHSELKTLHNGTSLVIRSREYAEHSEKLFSETVRSLRKILGEEKFTAYEDLGYLGILKQNFSDLGFENSKMTVSITNDPRTGKWTETWAITPSQGRGFVKVARNLEIQNLRLGPLIALFPESGK